MLFCDFWFLHEKKIRRFLDFNHEIHRITVEKRNVYNNERKWDERFVYESCNKISLLYHFS